jgi:apolipoprotein N-acyltransferase
MSAFLVACIIAYGYHGIREKAGKNSEGKPFRAVIIQGNIDQSVKWNPEYQKRTLAIYRRLSEAAACFNPQIIIWPETAVPFFFQDGSPLSQQVLEVAKTTHATILFGSPAYDKEKGIILYYNRAYAVSGEEIAGYYDKVHLVPFGEYVPLKRYLPFVHRLVPAAGDFSAGRTLKPITTADLRLGALICFEAIFPDIARRLTIAGTDLLVNITNDAWFGRTSAPYQHLSMAVFRSIENGLPMVRAANTGISAIILSDGRVFDRTGLFSRDVLKGEIKLTRKKTFYSHYGDIFAIIITIITILRCGYIVITRRRKSHDLYRNSRENRFPQ